ncbi:hypothetical protein [Marinobacterium aestuariivivens]|uniref:Uncharacterized protein n=1 Tax=Marinobacterium aestuariivivens TaxID=1698799 RepID=A0ABW2A208_9GAMM
MIDSDIRNISSREMRPLVINGKPHENNRLAFKMRNSNRSHVSGIFVLLVSLSFAA